MKLALLAGALVGLAACGPKPVPAPPAASSQPPPAPPAAGDTGAGASADDLAPAQAVIKALYAAPRTPFPTQPDADPYFTPDLARALKADSHPGEVGAIDFDYRYGAQDVQITDLAFGTAMASPESGGATEAVMFNNIGKPYEVDYDLLPTASGWRIADVTAPAQNGDMAWSLRAMLKLGAIK